MKSFLTFLFSVATAGFLLLLFATSLAVGTFIENSYGTEAARSLVYNAWWLELIMILLSANMIANFIRHKMYRKAKLTIGIFHLAFILIIIGAGVTRYFGSEGVIHIREGESSNILVSTETKLNLLTSFQGEQKHFSASAGAETLAQNKLAANIQVGGKEFSLKSTSYMVDAQRTLIPDPQGEPMIDFVYAQGGGMKSELLHMGQIINANGLTIGFNADANIRFILRGDSLKLVANDIIHASNMQAQELPATSPEKEIVCVEKMIYQVSGTSLVVKKFSKAARAEAVAGNGKQTGENALVIQLADNQKQQNITLWTTSQNESSKYTGSFNGIDFQMWIGPEEKVLPFSLKLNDFVLVRYPGSNSPSSYESMVTLTDKELGITQDYKIFMNNILNHRGYRFYQSSYDMDERGTILSVNHDMAGSLITYLGYFLLFMGILLSIFNPNSHFFSLMKRASAGTALVLLFLLQSSFSARAADPQPVSSEIAKEFAKVWVQGHDGRIKPFSTLAYEMVMKVSRAEAVAGQIPEAVVLGMLAYPQEWQQVPMIAISDDQIGSKLGISSSKASFNDFFDAQGNYKLANDVQAAFAMKPGDRKLIDNNVIKIDDRLNVVYQIYHGDMYKFFPSPDRTDQVWYTPIAHFPSSFGPDSSLVARVFPDFVMALRSGNTELAGKSVGMIIGYQEHYGSALIPGETKQQLEIFYNRINIFKNLSVLYLLLGLALFGFFFYSVLTGKKLNQRAIKYIVVTLFLGFIAQCSGLIIRGLVSGHLPWSNGYESMIYIAWAVMLAGLIFARTNAMVLSVSSILSGLTLFVAQMSWLNPEITNLVPVLRSYWLAIHVAVITASYGFLGVSAIIGFVNLLMGSFRTQANNSRINLSISQLTTINEASMILGLYMLTIGTFLGGVWANESWGRYWGWDAKETWALISVLYYGFISHMRLIPGLRGWFAYNLASVIGLLSVLMTYLGVNYYLSGLHSYGSGEGLQFPVSLIVIYGLVAIIAFVANKKEATSKIE
jgi:cytochrome c-type biogenesis protein CcsB